MIRKHIKTKGIILGSKSLGEADKLLFIYTREHGKIKAVAKGALKPTSKFMGTTETLSVCTFEIYKSSRSTNVTDLRLEENYRFIRGNLNRITSALLITKLADQFLMEDDSFPGVFELIDTTLKEIEKTNKTLLISTTFAIKLLDLLGLLPNFNSIGNSFPIKLDTKSKHLIDFIAKNPFSEIKKISLTTDESKNLKNLLSNFVENAKTSL